MRQVSKNEFYKFIINYPIELERHVSTIFEPPIIVYYDNTTAMAYHLVDEVGLGYEWKIEDIPQECGTIGNENAI